MRNRNGQEVLFTRDVAMMFNVSMSTVRNWVKAKKITATKGHNKKIYILKKSLDHMLTNTSFEIRLQRSREEVINKMLLHNLDKIELALITKELKMSLKNTHNVSVALKRYQSQEGLNPTGVFDFATIKYMNNKIHQPKGYAKDRLNFVSYPSTYKSSTKRSISKIVVFDSGRFELDESFCHHVLDNVSVHYIIDYLGNIVNTLSVDEISTIIKQKGRDNAISVELVNPFKLNNSSVFNISNHSHVETIIPNSTINRRTNIGHSVAQIKSLTILLNMLSMKHSIPKLFPIDNSMRFYNNSSGYFNRLFSGVCMSYNTSVVDCQSVVDFENELLDNEWKGVIV